MRKFLLFLLLGLPLLLAAQQAPITGVVRGTDNDPLPGVTVSVKNGAAAVKSESSGVYSINAKANDTLIFAMIGYGTQEIAVSDRLNIDVSLQAESSDLEEIVVVGYGAVRKSDLTSSITSVKGEDLKTFTSGTALQSLQGKANGVQVAGAGGPGVSPRVIIRGITTVNGLSPLYVVDNVPLNVDNINFLNPDDIESMEVLKDASASAIYGTRASNGVILVTTKKGKAGKVTLSFNGSTGLESLAKPDLATADVYEKVFKTRYTNDGNEPLWRTDHNLTAQDGTDWWDEIIKPVAQIHNYNVGFQGGSDKNVFSGSFGYFRQGSQYDVGYWDRLSFRVNNEYTLNPKVKLGFDFAPRYESWDNTPDLLGSTMRMDPTTPVFRPESEWVSNPLNNYARSYHNQNLNPAGQVARINHYTRQYGLIMTPQVTVTPIEGLTIRSLFNINGRFETENRFLPQFYIDNLEQEQQSFVERRQDGFLDWNWTNTANYMFDLDQHHFNVLGGFTMEKFSTYGLLGSRRNVPSNHPDLHYVDAGTLEERSNGTDAYVTMNSLLARLMYNYNGKYYLTATIRRDGSSRFPTGNKFATFPSISGAWRISSEDFMQNQNLFQDIKLRAGWGRVGNQAIQPGMFLNQIGPADYVFGREPNRYVGTGISVVGNPLLRWETVEDVNLGVDLAFLQNKFTMSVDWFRKQSKDLLMERNNPLVLGYPMWDSRMWSNIGSIESKGWEFALNYRDAKEEFSYDFGLNVTAVQNKALEFAMDAPIREVDVFGHLAIINTPGQPLSQFLGYQIDGVFQNAEQVASHVGPDGALIQPYAQPGDFIFQDVNGDGQINEDDKVILGKAFPDFTLGFNTRLGYKNFDFVANFYASVGNEILNLPKAGFYSGENGQNVYADAFDKAWNGEGSSNTHARLSNADRNNNYRVPSSFMVEDGSFLRAKLLQFGYTLPSSVWSAGQLRVSLSAQNAFTITKYSGLDPEVASLGGADGGALNAGVDRLGYPNPRTFLLGVNLTF